MACSISTAQEGSQGCMTRLCANSKGMRGGRGGGFDADIIIKSRHALPSWAVEMESAIRESQFTEYFERGEARPLSLSSLAPQRRPAHTLRDCGVHQSDCACAE